MPRKGQRTRVITTRVYELYCEEHGVLECHTNYERIKEERQVHRTLHPECFIPRPAVDSNHVKYFNWLKGKYGWVLGSYILLYWVAPDEIALDGDLHHYYRHYFP